MFVTLKVLFLRYRYMLRQRWCLTLCYMLFPSILLLLAVWAYNTFPYSEFEGGSYYNTDQDLLQIPKPMAIVVCPNSNEVRQLMDEVQRTLHLGNATKASTPLEITFVKNAQLMTNLLVSEKHANITMGLHFHEINSTKLEYTIRPLAFSVPAINGDWGNYHTSETFPSPMYRGPLESDPYFEERFTHTSGPIHLQVAIDKAYIHIHFPKAVRHWTLVSFPYPSYFDADPEYTQGFTHRFVLLLVEYLVITGIILMISVLASSIIRDKTSGIRELMSINGACRWMVNPSWLVSFCLEATILAIAEMEILKIETEKGDLFQYMSVSVLAVVLIVYNVSSLCWVYLIATISTNQVLCVSAVAAYWGISPIFLEWIPPGRFTLQKCLAPFPNTGMVLIFKSFQEFDGAETVLDWDRLTTSPIHYLPVHEVLLIMLATSVFLVFLSTYVDLVKPGPYGRDTPWYLFRQKDKKESLPADGTAASDDMYFDNINKKDPVGLECVGLYKFFGKNKAINNVNLKIMQNRVTVLLGRNGSGKTSLISILCGMLSPTRGKLYTEEYDVFKESSMRRFRKVLGYCPQSNIVMNDLTFQQNMIIFTMLKGLSRYEAEEYSDKWVEMFDMKKCQNRQVKHLSGGERRKLTLAIAMSGKPQYLFLDNPTSGLDPRSTRKFWNLILRKKAKCTVFMSTHNVDEADILGDHIVFMENGVLKAHASSSFIKKKIDIGYKVKCTVNKNNIENLIRSMTNFNRSIRVLSRLNQSVTFGLPSDFKPKDVPSCLQSLESKFEGNISFEVSNVTINDVFVKFMAEEQKVSLEELKVRENDVDRSICSFRQVTELFRKKRRWTCSQSLISMLVSVMVLPALGMGLASYLINKTLGRRMFPPVRHAGTLKLTMDKYSGTLAVISKHKSEINDALRSAMMSSGITYEEVERDIINFLEYSLARKDLFEYRSKYVVAFEATNQTCAAYYSRNAYHSAPIAYSALINAILNGKAAIVTYNSPFLKQHDRSACSFDNTLVTELLFSNIFGYMLLIAGSYFITFPHRERRTLFKQLQLMTGLLPVVYWISNILFDMVIFSISCMLIIIVVTIIDSNFFWDFTGVCILVIVLFLYGISSIMFSYVWSFCPCATSTVVAWYIFINPFLYIGFSFLEVIASFSPAYFLPTDKHLHFLPWVTLMDSLRKISGWAVKSRQCYVCDNVASCAEIMEVTLIGSLRRNVITFVCISLGYLCILLAMDHGFGRRLKPIIYRACHGDIVGDSCCPEIAAEKGLVRDLDTDEEKGQPELVCDGLGKKYSSKITAVHDVTFVTERGELFGLLGLNGAGRSTTFRMLVGMTSPTKGTATIRGKYELGDCEYLYIRNIGYCPQGQFEGLLPGLPGRTILRLFGRLRGLKEHLLDHRVEKWLEALDMKSVADRPCEQYGGGDRKKLNFAIAMIVNPSVVFLDEPTTGVDPFVKIKILEILVDFSKQGNQAIVMTTHNMVECEATCDRLLIIVSGQMKCIGSVPALKKTLGKICTLHVKFLDRTTPAQVDVIQFKIEFRFSGYISLQEKQHNLLIYHVTTEKMKIYNVFAIMVKMKEENGAIDNFSVADAPLVDVFSLFTQED